MSGFERRVRGPKDFSTKAPLDFFGEVGSAIITLIANLTMRIDVSLTLKRTGPNATVFGTRTGRLTLTGEGLAYVLFTMFNPGTGASGMNWGFVTEENPDDWDPQVTDNYSSAIDASGGWPISDWVGDAPGGGPTAVIPTIVNLQTVGATPVGTNPYTIAYGLKERIKIRLPSAVHAGGGDQLIHGAYLIAGPFSGIRFLIGFLDFSDTPITIEEKDDPSSELTCQNDSMTVKYTNEDAPEGPTHEGMIRLLESFIDYDGEIHYFSFVEAAGFTAFSIADTWASHPGWSATTNPSTDFQMQVPALGGNPVIPPDNLSASWTLERNLLGGLPTIVTPFLSKGVFIRTDATPKTLWQTGLWSKDEQIKTGRPVRVNMIANVTNEEP